MNAVGKETEVVEREMARGSCCGEQSKTGRVEGTTIDRVGVSHNIRPDPVVKIHARGIVEHAFPLQVLPTTQTFPRIRVQKDSARQSGGKEVRTGVTMGEYGAKASLWTRIKKKMLHWNGKNRD